MQLHEINALLTLDTDFILHSETWLSSVSLDDSLKLDFVSKLPTSRSLFLILDQNKWVLHVSRCWLGTINWWIFENVWLKIFSVKGVIHGNNILGGDYACDESVITKKW